MFCVSREILKDVYVQSHCKRFRTFERAESFLIKVKIELPHESVVMRAVPSFYGHPTVGAESPELS